MSEVPSNEAAVLKMTSDNFAIEHEPEVHFHTRFKSLY